MSDAITRLNAALEGRYTIERKLGEGGMATVYLADDLKHSLKVALKVLKPELAAVVGAEWFLGEITTTAVTWGERRVAWQTMTSRRTASPLSWWRCRPRRTPRLPE